MPPWISRATHSSSSTHTNGVSQQQVRDWILYTADHQPQEEDGGAATRRAHRYTFITNFGLRVRR